MNTSTVFAALGDENRLALLDRLATQGRTATGELADGLPITRQAVAKHLKVLHEAGLIESRTAGRETLHTVRPQGLEPVAGWLEESKAAWRRRLLDVKQRAESG